MAKFFWIVIITVIAGLVQLMTYKSLEIIMILFSINFMVFGIELGKNKTKRNIIPKIEGLERTLNDIMSRLISPSLSKREKQKKNIEWLNHF